MNTHLPSLRRTPAAALVLFACILPAAGQPAFTTHTLVEDGRFNNQPTLSLDGSGAAHLLYSSQLHTDSTTKEVWYATNAGGTWAHLQLTLNSVRDEGPCIALDASGNVHAAFHTGSPSVNRLRYVNNVGGAFAGNEAGIIDLAVASPASVGYINPKIACDTDGNVHAVFTNSGAANVDVFYLRRGADGTIVGPTNLTNSPQSEQEPALFIGPGGVVHIAYRFPLAGATQVGYQRSTGPGGAFEAVPTFITPFTGGFPVPLVTQANALSIVYRQSNTLRYANANPDGSWADPAVSFDLSPASIPSGYERLAVGPGGRRHLAFAANNAAGRGTWFRRESAVTDVFEDAIDLNTIQPTRTNGGTSIAVSAAGRIVVAWNLSWFDSVTARSVSDIYVSTHDPVVSCPADFNGSGDATVQDIYDFLADWSSQSAGGPVIIASADFNSSGDVTVQDIYDFLAAWSAGCP